MVWSKITQVFSFGSQWGDDTIRLVEGDNALAMVKRVEGILEDSMRVLQSHERVLTSTEFDIFSIKHRNLVLKVVEVKQEAHRQQQQSIFSATYAERGTDRVTLDVVRLQSQAEIYYQDLLTASRRAQLDEEERFFRRHQESQTESSDPTATCYSVVSSRSSTMSELSSDDTTLADHQPYMAVVHVRTENPEELADDDSVREILVLENKAKTVVMFNPNPGDENALLDLSRAARVILRTPNPNNLHGYETVKNSQHETSWIDSFVNSLARLGAGIGADMM